MDRDRSTTRTSVAVASILDSFDVSSLQLGDVGRDLGTACLRGARQFLARGFGVDLFVKAATIAVDQQPLGEGQRKTWLCG